MRACGQCPGIDDRATGHVCAHSGHVGDVRSVSSVRAQANATWRRFSALIDGNACATGRIDLMRTRTVGGHRRSCSGRLADQLTIGETGTRTAGGTRAPQGDLAVYPKQLSAVIIDLLATARGLKLDTPAIPALRSISSAKAAPATSGATANYCPIPDQFKTVIASSGFCHSTGPIAGGACDLTTPAPCQRSQETPAHQTFERQSSYPWRGFSCFMSSPAVQRGIGPKGTLAR